MIIREVHLDEWPQLEEVFKAEGGNLPHPTTANVMGAFDAEGKLIGFWCFQLSYHAGPLWIHPEHRGTKLWQKIHEKLCSWLSTTSVSSFYSFSGQSKVESIFKQLGYKDLGYKVWTKEIK